MHSSSSARVRRVDRVELAILGLSIVLVVAFYFLRSGNREGYYAFVREDGVAENMQALFCLASSVIGFVVARRLMAVRQMFLGGMFVLFGAGMFLLFGEEISWGQRIVGWESSEYFQARNMQSETNLHNDERLKNIVHPIGIAVGIYAVMSAFLHLSFVRRGARTASYFTTEWPVMGYFAVFTGVYVIYEYINPFIRPWYGFDFILWQDLEMAETFFTAGILGWSVLKLRSVEKLFGMPAANPARRGGRRALKPAVVSVRAS